MVRLLAVLTISLAAMPVGPQSTLAHPGSKWGLQDGSGTTYASGYITR